MNLLENLKQTYRQGNAVTRLIFLNVALYLLLHIFMIVMKLFYIQVDFLYPLLALPSNFGTLLYKPWTLVTYMFLHRDFFHILFNMLALFWFGKLFLMFFTGKQLFGLYFFGGLTAGLMYIIAYNIFPLYLPLAGISVLMGASGSIMAVIVATAVQSPNMEMRFLLIGAVKLKYIAIAAVLISFFGITSSNAGGELAHLGGALYGYFFIVSLRRGSDTTRWISRLLDSINNLFKPRRLKVKKGGAYRPGKMSDAEYNVQKARNMAEVDRILDKIKASGYGSLTEDEKNILFQQRKN